MIEKEGKTESIDVKLDRWWFESIRSIKKENEQSQNFRKQAKNLRSNPLTLVNLVCLLLFTTKKKKKLQSSWVIVWIIKLVLLFDCCENPCLCTPTNCFFHALPTTLAWLNRQLIFLDIMLTQEEISCKALSTRSVGNTRKWDTKCVGGRGRTNWNRRRTETMRNISKAPQICSKYKGTTREGSSRHHWQVNKNCGLMSFVLGP